jgi:hypothetical protein
MQLVKHVKPLVERADASNTRSSFDADYCINLVSHALGKRSHARNLLC